MAKCLAHIYPLLTESVQFRGSGCSPRLFMLCALTAFERGRLTELVQFRGSGYYSLVLMLHCLVTPWGSAGRQLPRTELLELVVCDLVSQFSFREYGN